MIDYKLFDVLKLFEEMTGKDFMYLSNAVMHGKLGEIKLTFEVEKDSHEVPVKVQHFVELTYNEK